MRHFSPVLCAALVVCSLAPLHAEESPSANPRRLLLMVQYLGTDYGNAVHDGKVKEPAEYDEAVQNAQDALRMARELVKSSAIEARLVELQKLVEHKADARKVETFVAALVPDLTKELKLAPAPVDIPDLALGRQRFEALCSSCHGMGGKGDGPAAASLKPPPAVMADPEWADTHAPFQVFNTITMGLPGTAMASFAADLPVEERWSVAFYVVTLRQPGSPPALDAALPVRELAASSNKILAEKLRAKAPAMSAVDALAKVDAARRVMPTPPSFDTAMHAMNAAALSVEELVQQGRHDVALERVRNTYMDMVEPVEKALREKIPAETADLEGSVTNLRRAINARDPVTTHISAVSAAIEKVRAAWARAQSAPAPAKAALPTVELDRTGDEDTQMPLLLDGEITPHRVAGIVGFLGLVVTLVLHTLQKRKKP